MKVEEEKLRVARRTQVELLAPAQASAVTRPEFFAVYRHDSTDDLNPAMSTGRELVSGQLSRVEPTGKERYVLVHGNRVFATVSGRHENEIATSFLERGRSLLVSRIEIVLLREDPDLQKVERLGRGGIELTVSHSRTCGHAL